MIVFNVCISDYDNSPINLFSIAVPCILKTLYICYIPLRRNPVHFALVTLAIWNEAIINKAATTLLLFRDMFRQLRNSL